MHCAALLVVSLALVPPPAETASDGLVPEGPERIWGRVALAGGEVLEGFLRWDRNEAVWDDVLDGERRTDEARLERLRALLADDPDRRSVNLLGLRVTWTEDDDLAAATTSGIRFRWIARLTPDGDAADLELVTGERVRLESASSDLGSGFRGLEVETGTSVRDVDWDQIVEVRFGPAPAARTSQRRRLHGTVESESGLRFTGWIGWDLDEVFGSEVLDGEERKIPFDDIAAIERVRSGARVTLVSGDEVVLTGTNDVNAGNRGIEVNDPGLGRVTLGWRAFRSLRLHPPAGGAPAIERGGALRGELETESGTTFSGEIIWDLDEGSGWEFIDGTTEGIEFDIEFSHVGEIVKLRDGGAEVRLLDGRSFRLAGSNDVNRSNRGIVIRAADGTDTLIDWSGFSRARLTGGDR